MTKIKNSGLEQCGAELFGQQQFGPAGVEGVNQSLKFSDTDACIIPPQIE